MIDPKEVNESLEGVEELPEAPLSIHIDSYYKGFHAGITIRGTDNKIVPVSKVKNMIDGLIAQGFMPSWNEDTNMAHNGQKATVGHSTTSEACPKCGSPLVEAKTKDGTTFIKCSTNKWNKFKKMATGCDYVKWPERE